MLGRDHPYEVYRCVWIVQEYYAANPTAYTQIGHDRWEPHYMYIGEVLEAIEGQFVHVTNEDVHSIFNSLEYCECCI